MDYSLQDTPVFIINLPQSTDRKAFMKAQCDSIGISPIFIDAVNGKNLSDSDVSQYCNQKKAKQLFGRELLLGEIGCALSHKKIYQKIVDGNIAYAIIFEDDAVIKEGLNDIIKLILASDINWELVLLGHNKGLSKRKEVNSLKSYWGSIQLNEKFILGRVAKGGLGAFGYMVSNNGAKKLLDYINLEKIIFPIDKATSNSKVINIIGLFPSAVTVDPKFESEIENNSFRCNDGQDFFVYKVAKLIKKTPFFNLTQKIWFTVLKIKPVKRYN